MAREKTVYQTDEIAHLWAHQSQDSARNPQSNHRFDGSILYSYAEPIGRIVKAAGATVALFIDNTWSVTTSRHQQRMRSAASHLPSFTVANIAALPYSRAATGKVEHKINLKRYAERIVSAAQEAQRARSNKDWKLRNLTALVDEANRYAATFKLATRFSVPSDVDLAKLREEAQIEAAKLVKRNAARAAEQEERQAKYRLLQSAALEAWKNHQPLPDDAPHYWHNLGRSYMRVEGAEVVTTGGARVSLEHVRRALPIVLRLLERGEAYQRNGHTIHVGAFALDSIDTSGVVRCGCHTFDRSEVERIAKVVEATPAQPAPAVA